MIGLRLALVGALAIAPVPALAQSDTGTRMGGRPAQLPETGTNAQRARIWLEGYARCVYRRDPKRVGDVIDAGIADNVSLSRLSDGNFDPCLSTGGGASKLAMSDQVFRGALYADRVTATVRNLPASRLPAALLVVPQDPALPAEVKARIALVRFGECVMRQQPEAALAFVAAGAGSDSESASLATLAPLLGSCLEQGSKVSISRSVLEAAMAEAIYRTVRAPAAEGGR